MANSIAIANVEIQLQDALQSGIPPVLFRTVPPISYPSQYQVAYNGYTQLNPGSSQALISGGQEYPFVYLRNAGSRGIIILTANTVVASSEPIKMSLTPGGLFLFANSKLALAGSANTISALSITTGDSNPIIAEWLIAQ